MARLVKAAGFRGASGGAETYMSLRTVLKELKMGHIDHGTENPR